MVSIECVYDSLIYCSHVACVVFVWPMLIRPWAYDDDSSQHQLHKHTRTHNLKISRTWFGLVNVARLTFFVCVLFFSPSSSLTI